MSGLSMADRKNSVGYLDAKALQEKAEMDKHVAHYVNDQLARMKSHDSDDYDGAEFETTAEGFKSNGHGNGNGNAKGYFH